MLLRHTVTHTKLSSLHNTHTYHTLLTHKLFGRTNTHNHSLTHTHDNTSVKCRQVGTLGKLASLSLSVLLVNTTWRNLLAWSCTSECVTHTHIKDGCSDDDVEFTTTERSPISYPTCLTQCLHSSRLPYALKLLFRSVLCVIFFTLYTYTHGKQTRISNPPLSLSLSLLVTFETNIKADTQTHTHRAESIWYNTEQLQAPSVSLTTAQMPLSNLSPYNFGSHGRQAMAWRWDCRGAYSQSV